MDSCTYFLNKIEGIVFLNKINDKYSVDTTTSTVCSMSFLNAYKTILAKNINSESDILSCSKPTKNHKCTLYTFSTLLIFLQHPKSKKISKDECIHYYYHKMNFKIHELCLNTIHEATLLKKIGDSLRNVCEQIYINTDAEHVLVNVLFDNHYACLESYPKQISHIWKCHSVCHAIHGDTFLPNIDISDHPLDSMTCNSCSYSGIIIDEENKVMLCCLASNGKNHVQTLNKHKASIQKCVQILVNNDMLTKGTWEDSMYMKIDHLEAKKPCSTKHCQIL